MTLEQLLPLLLGPLGLTVGALVVVFMFSTDRWVSGKRLREAQDLLDKSLDGNESIAKAMAARNELEKAIAVRGGGSVLSDALIQAETAVETHRQRPTGSPSTGSGSQRSRRRAGGC